MSKKINEDQSPTKEMKSNTASVNNTDNEVKNATESTKFNNSTNSRDGAWKKHKSVWLARMCIALVYLIGSAEGRKYNIINKYLYTQRSDSLNKGKISFKHTTS